MKKTILFAALAACLAITPSVFAGTINLNKADAAALDTLDGIGAKKAEAIIAYRTTHGEFKTLDTLKDVPGIGEKLFEKIAPSLSLTDDATAPAATAATDTKASPPTAASTTPTANAATDNKTSTPAATTSDTKATPAATTGDKAAGTKAKTENNT